MNQEIEIEFKNLLTKEEYERITERYFPDQHPIANQVNHYFDTKTFSLKNLHSALRIREKQGKRVLTLKQPLKEGILETHQALSENEAETIIQHGILPAGQVADLLFDMGIQPQSLHYFGSLETNRMELEIEGGLLVLDHSLYLGHEDFELEFEAIHYENGKKQFEDLLKSLNIPSRSTDNKIKRFYDRKFK